MQLEPHQVYELMDYVHEIRKHFLKTNELTSKVFLQWNESENFHSITQTLLLHLTEDKQQDKKL